MTQPLSGCKVVELAEGIAGPYAGKLLADYGADVIKVEPAQGDASRHFGPFPDEPHIEKSATFAHVNTNKRSVVVGDDADAVDALVDWADVVICSSPDIDAARWRQRNPALVVVSVTSFGLSGPYSNYKGSEIVHTALGGPLSAAGNEDREPVKMGGEVGQYQCGTMAAAAALSGLAMAEHSGVGTHIDLANVETQITSIDRRMTYLLYAAYRGSNVARTGGYRAGLLPNGCRAASDGHVQISTLMNWIPRMLGVVDEPMLTQMYQEPGWILDETLPDIADAMVLGWSASRTRQQAMEEAQAEGWPVTAVNRPIDLLTDPHFTAREYFVSVDHPALGTIRQAGAPFRMADGWKLRRPAPMLGAHTDEVLAEVSTGQPETTKPPSPDADQSLPFEGIRVLDMTVVWAGPYTTMMLGDLGAEIIRVDNPYIFPSATRGLMPRPSAEMIADIGGIFGGYPDADPGERPWNRMALFNAHARNKKSVTLDVRQDIGREAFLRLAAQCDVMVENNSVDLLDKLGIGWDELHQLNPRLILVRMPSVGLEGPYSRYLGFGVNFEALVGLGALRGYADTDLSENDSVFHMDAASGSAGAFAVMAALRRREQTGIGELVELSQSENMLNHIGEMIIEADVAGVAHDKIGNRHPHRAPQGVYRSKGEDAWVAISVGDDSEWAGLAKAADNPEWMSDERFSTAEGRRTHHDEIDQYITQWTTALSAYEVFHRCQQNQVPAAPVLHELETFEDEHLKARSLFRSNGNDDTGEHLHASHIWRWDGPDMKWGKLPVLGGDNESVFKQIAGLSDNEYQALVDGGHISGDYLDPGGNSL